MDIVVKKMWWENAAELYKSCQNILDDHRKWKKQIVVVSAIRSQKTNTTDYLIELGKLLGEEKPNIEKALEILNTIHLFHREVSAEKLSEYDIKVEEFIDTFFKILQSDIHYYIKQENKIIIPCPENDYSIVNHKGKVISLLWFWEYLSSEILSHVLSQIGTDIKWISIDLWSLVSNDETKHLDEQALFSLLEEKIYSVTNHHIDSGNVPILSWYIWVLDGWIEYAIGRWYSDATAAICIVWYAHNGYSWILEIQKSVKWVLTADPRVLYNPESARLIKEIDYVIAREITGDSWANAKLLHSQAIREEVQDAGVKILLFDPFSSDKDNGTWVLPKATKTSGKIFVGGRNNIVFFSISSGKMFQSGVLANIFWVVREYFSVDIISASETEVTFTIDASKDISKKLDTMSEKLRIICNIQENTHMEFVEYETDRALIFCIGQHMRDNVWLLARASNILSENNINIELVSQWRLQRAMVFGIDWKYMQKAINVLHEAFITDLQYSNN